MTLNITWLRRSRSVLGNQRVQTCLLTAGRDFANLHDGKDASAWSMRRNTVERQDCKNCLISGISWHVDAKLFVPGAGSRANGCLGYLAIYEPFKKPRCDGHFMSIRYETQAS